MNAAPYITYIHVFIICYTIHKTLQNVDELYTNVGTSMNISIIRRGIQIRCVHCTEILLPELCLLQKGVVCFGSSRLMVYTLVTLR